ncbi:MAG: S8 family serine peptidase [Methanomicrobiales archaeon]|nr:S8 family serine peptidase [Methanomicrobiales archaeon]
MGLFYAAFRISVRCAFILVLISSLCQAISITDEPGLHLHEEKTIETGVDNLQTIQTEGDLLVRSNGIREVFGASGNGVKIGVIGNGVESLAQSQKSGELGKITVLETGSGDEGTAMLEIIHDIAPDAELFFNAYGGNSSEFKKAVTDLAESGCQVICDDLYFFRQPFLEDGDVADHIRDVLTRYPNLIYITVSGNFASLHYQKPWKPGITAGPGKTIHDFGDGTSAIRITLLPDDEIVITLQWDDPWGYPTHDYDLFLTDPRKGEVLATSMYIQEESKEPFEHLVYHWQGSEPTTVSLSIIRNGENLTPNILEMFIRNIDARQVESDIVKDPRDSIFGHAALEEVITVGSVGITTPYEISPDSSRGPVTIQVPYQARRWKPDICAPTNVQVSGAGSFPVPFPGTSAAAPHVAGVVAQLLSAFPGITRADLTDAIYSSTFDLGYPGWDFTYGYGLIDAVKTFQTLYETRNEPYHSNLS